MRHRPRLRQILLGFGVALVVVALIVDAALVYVLLQREGEVLARQRLNALTLPIVAQLRDLMEVGLAPDDALDRLRAESDALRLHLGVLGPTGRVLRDNADGLLQGAEIGLSVGELPSAPSAPYLGAVETRDGQRYRFAAVSATSLGPVPGRPDLGGFIVAERADASPLRPRALVLALGGGALGGLILALLFGLWLARRMSRSAERLALAADALAAGGGGSALPSQGPRELAHLVERLEALRAELGRTRQGARGLVTAVGQLIRQPLANIRAGFAEVIKATDATSEEREVALRLLDDELRRMQQLIAQMYAFARLQTHQVGMERQPVDLPALVTQAVDRAAETARQRGLDVQLETDGQLVTVLGDPDRLEQAVTALLDHALHRAGEGGQVAVSVGVLQPEGEQSDKRRGRRRSAGEAPSAWVSVHYPGDFGLHEHPERIFDLLGSAAEEDASVEERLALAIAREIVRAHGGSVLAEGDPLTGARLALLLPVATDADAQPLPASPTG